MNILFDTNILLDVLLEREPFYLNSATLVAYVEQEKLAGWLGATTITTLHYLMGKETNKETANIAIQKILSLFNVSPVNRVVLEESLSLAFNDFKDAVLHQSAAHANLNGIVTRNGKDFQKAKLPIYSPEELVKIIEGH